MTEGENMVERCAVTMIRWMDAFATIGHGASFPPAPSTAEWSDYAKVEQAAARLAARAVIEALMAPTPEMVKAGIGTSEVDAVDWVGALFGTGVGSYEQIMVSSFQAMLRTALSQPNEEGEGK